MQKWAMWLAVALMVIGAPIARAAPGDNLEILLVTFGPGDDPWEKFGHNALVIEDSDAQTKVAYNWGVFDFGEGLPGFLSFTGRFIQGKLLYSMQSDPADPLVEAYERGGRTVRVQELYFTAAQKLELKARLERNDTPQNRYYLYDYYLNNCSTKTRDAIDQTVGGRVKAALEPIPTQTTFRSHTRRLTADSLWLYTSLNFILGHPVDHRLSAWQESFLPEKLADHLRSVKVVAEDGELVPLVQSDKVIFRGMFSERSRPPDHFVFGFLGAGAAIGAIVVLAVLLMRRRRRTGMVVFVTVAVAWSLIAGIGGGLCVWGWFFTNHVAARWNENLLQCFPLSLAMVYFAPAARRWRKTALWIAASLAGLSLLGLMLKILPWFYQSNRDIIALALPAHLGMLVGVYWLTRQSAAKDAGAAKAPRAAESEIRS